MTVKRHYQVTTWDGDGRKRDRLGIGVGGEDQQTCTYKVAKEMLAEWKRVTSIQKAVLFLDGKPIEQWERSPEGTSVWPKTVVVVTEE